MTCALSDCSSHTECPCRASEHATVCAALNCALTLVSEVSGSVTPHPGPMCYKASESQVDKISIITSPVVSFLPLAGHWTAPDSDGGKTKISPQAKTVSCENTITAIRDAFCDANTLKSTSRANPLKHGSLILNRGGLLMFQSSHNKACQGP